MILNELDGKNVRDLVKSGLQFQNTKGDEEEGGAVIHPKHYNAHPSGVECIDIIKHMTFCLGSAMKYIWRNGLKDGEADIRDLRKAIWYIEEEIRLRESRANG